MQQKFSIILPLFLVIIILLPTILYAQPIDPSGDPAPIDGGASIVAVVCAGYLARRKKLKSTKN